MDSMLTKRLAKVFSREPFTLSSLLIRAGGLAAIVAAVTLIGADLESFFAAFSPLSYPVLYLRDSVADWTGWLLLIGLVAIYAHQRKALGIPGLIGFLEAFGGMMLAQWDFVWPEVLSSIGWVFLGAMSLDAEAYPAAAALLLLIGAGLTGVANVLIESGLLLSSPFYVAGAMTADIIFNVAIAWLSLSFFTRRSEEDPYAMQ
jgi:hypothetical protein